MNLNLERNVGLLDRLMRSLLGVVMLTASFYTRTKRALSVILAILGSLQVIVGLTGHCLIYALFDYSTVSE